MSDLKQLFMGIMQEMYCRPGLFCLLLMFYALNSKNEVHINGPRANKR